MANSADMDKALVSVIVPMRNAENYISATLASILHETDTALEAIIVDDKSSDASLEKARDFPDGRIRIIEGPGRGISACMNAGVAASRGEIIMRCDADDLYYPGKIAQQARWLKEHLQFIGVCGSFSTIDDRGRLVAELTASIGKQEEEITDELRQGITRTHLCSFAVRAQAVRQLKGFREYFETAEDLDFQLRLAGVGRVGYVPRTWYQYRLHGASVTHNQSTPRREFFEHTARRFCRQRQESGQDDLDLGSPPTPPETASGSPFLASRHIQDILIGQAWQEHRAGLYAKAIRTGLRAALSGPREFRAWKSLAALAVKALFRMRVS